MGKKISIDSATMMNKVFEIIEAKNIFNIDYQKIIYFNSYQVLTFMQLIKFKNGLIKIIAHDTNMRVPIFNTLYENINKSFNSKNLQIDKLNHLDFKNVDLIKFPINKYYKTFTGKKLTCLKL
jgi:1-deoxy-D-xylulose-5-phosphate reductoisomerase